MNAHAQPLLILVSAPSGAGKTTLCASLLAANPGLRRAVTCTTRPPRPGEREGIEYYFLSEESFRQELARDAFLEHANVYGNLYGTLKSEVLGKLRKGQDVLLNIDVQGAENVRRAAALEKELKAALVTVFLTTATWQELETRLRGRGTESPDVLERRLRTAELELAEAPKFDYILTSGTPDEDLRRMQCILQAERMRTGRVKLPELRR
jgi:guanylate kinase